MLKITKFCSILTLVLFSLDCNSQVIGVGINTNDPKSTLDINGNLSVKVVTIPIASGDTSLQNISDGVYISVDPQANDQEFRLPAAAAVSGRIYIIRNINGLNAAAISSNGGLFFYKGTTTEANSTTHMIYLYEGNRTVFVVSDGFNWTVFN